MMSKKRLTKPQKQSDPQHLFQKWWFKAGLKQTEKMVANYLKQNHGQKVRDSKFKKEIKPGTVLNEQIQPKPKPIGLMEAAKKREELEEPSNLLAIDETNEDFMPKKGRKKNV